MDNYFGVFKEIIEMNSNIEEVNFYEGKFVNVYEQLSKETKINDFDYYQKYAACYGGPILELACGTGRITLQLAKKKYEVVGVDISQDMLKKFREKLDSEYKRLKSYITLYNQDITNLKLDKKYKLIILPITTIRLIKMDLTEFINKIYNILDDGGCFVFDFQDNYYDKDKLIYTPIKTTSFYDDSKQLNIVMHQDMIDSEHKVSSVNFYGNIIEKYCVKQYIGYTSHKVMKYDEVRDSILKSKFKDFDIYEYMNRYYFCELRK